MEAFAGETKRTSGLGEPIPCNTDVCKLSTSRFQGRSCESPLAGEVGRSTERLPPSHRNGTIYPPPVHPAGIREPAMPRPTLDLPGLRSKPAPILRSAEGLHGIQPVHKLARHGGRIRYIQCPPSIYKIRPSSCCQAGGRRRFRKGTWLSMETTHASGPV